MKTNLKLVRDAYNRIGILGNKTKVTKDWLGIQKIPFKKNAILHTMYPLTGGACVVDKNSIEIIDKVRQEHLDEVLSTSNPASDAINLLLKENK